MAEIKLCRHIMPSGLHCQSPAMRGSAFCYFHGRAPRPTRPARTQESNLEIPLLNSRREIVGALNRIMQALAANRISSRRAAVLLQAVQMASGQPLLGSDDVDDPLEHFLCPKLGPRAIHTKE
jgi:hypothetical protein